MTIETVCPECGKSYRVRDEMAGKRFRCKACHSAVSIPIPSDNDNGDNTDDDQFEDDFLGGLDTAVKAERRSPAGAPPPIAGRSTPGAPSKKKAKSRNKSSDSDSTGSAMKILVGLLAGAVGLVVGYLVVTALMGGSGTASWRGFTSPDAVWEVEFPAAPQPDESAGAAPGSKRYVGETSVLGAAVTEAPLPPNPAGFTPQQSLDQIVNQLTGQRPGATSSGRQTLTFGKHTATQITQTVDADGKKLSNTTRILLTDNAVYTLEFVSDGTDHTADRDRFFNSFELLSDTTATWSQAK